MANLKAIYQINGQPAKMTELKSLALLAYGNFTTFVVHQDGVQGLSLHLERLRKDSVQLHGEVVPYKTIIDYVHRAIAGQNLPLTVRVTIFRSDIDKSRPRTGYTKRPDVLISVQPVSSSHSPISLMTCEFERDLPQIKSLGLSSTLYRRSLAQQAGFDDALFYTRQDGISEGPTWNVGFIREDEVVVPNAHSLRGVTIQLIQKACQDQGIALSVQAVHLKNLVDMDAAFATNATLGIRVISGIDQQIFEQSSFVDNLRRIYSDIKKEKL